MLHSSISPAHTAREIAGALGREEICVIALAVAAAAPRKRRELGSVSGLSAMGIHLLAFAFVQVFQASAPLLWPLNLWLPLVRCFPEACAVARAALAAHVAWLRRACRPGAPV